MRFIPTTLLAALALLGACRVDAENWSKRFVVETPPTICKQTFFAECYAMDQAVCEAMARPIVEACLAEVKDKLPERMDPTSGGVWGRKIGECAGGRLAEKATVNDKCAAWLEQNLGPGSADQMRAEGAAAKASR